MTPDPQLPNRLPPRTLELWAGVDGTRNRVGAKYFDQLDRTGHSSRADDLDRIAALGVTTLRYPIPWERTAPAGPATARWGWADERLARIQMLGITPIIGFVHNGSGPPTTDLLDKSWPERLAQYAGAFAARYPWVQDYTPVNEPLTTARYSALEAHWYPHASDDRSFALALLTQLKGTVLAMRAIRDVQPAARLIQTEDLAFTRSTPRLQAHADFENERRWLTFELLMGRVAPGHSMHGFLTGVGINAAEIAWFAENPTPPDILGLNYYVRSERYLDDEPLYDAQPRMNGRNRFKNLDAAQTVGLAGLRALLSHARSRLDLPMAITETHLDGPRDEQLRWLVQAWDQANVALKCGMDIRAVTASSLFGSYDRDSHCTQALGHYESGAFDVRGTIPRPTALAHAVSDLAAGRRPRHPVLQSPGWWDR
jgi:dTDP-4-dehydrorhamnose reductase